MGHSNVEELILGVKTHWKYLLIDQPLPETGRGFLFWEFPWTNQAAV
jgi:hypothetical protein